ncbi:methyltransferase domain-containing protein [Flavobacterium sp.]|uniref:methyltransferase domain-containing protein n=1 Tax=Flavobacterium sp. TaxID=239 RepID=UPI0022CCA70B|nr:methyltransferase domain-containing protein [Flavobacterium sp.]MCZ8227889.1 methyltransferase domain-containing protein [Flavobacterium sp.]
MNFRVPTTYRTTSTEIMDDFSLEGEELREALDKIASINQFLGGNKVTLDGVKQLLGAISLNETITIVDIGCGNGDMLRTLAQYAQKSGLVVELIGIDANRFTVNHAQQLSAAYENISFRCEDIFDTSFKEVKADLFLCTLTLHHFKNEEIEYLLPLFYRNSRLGIVINDLQRSGLAYRLFQLLCVVFRLNTMSREDGLISILRGFTKEELIRFSNQMNFNKWSIRWRWAFRYQWIISKL